MLATCLTLAFGFASSFTASTDRGHHDETGEVMLMTVQSSTDEKMCAAQPSAACVHTSIQPFGLLIAEVSLSWQPDHSAMMPSANMICFSSSPAHCLRRHLGALVL